MLPKLDWLFNMKFRQSFWPSFFVFLGLMLVYMFTISFGSTNIDESQQKTMEQKNNTFTLTSIAFSNNEEIPSVYTCDSVNPVNPQLTISNVPKETVSMVLLMDDPDIPESVKRSRGIEVFDHWVLYGISPKVTSISADWKTDLGPLSLSKEGLNSLGKRGYTAPCPPDGKHRYFFKLYALNGDLNFSTPPTKKEVIDAMQGMIIAETELVGTYERK